uniref:Uncharacterized protein n=1 Tax=Adineta vaga TaxID=104782 RepID=B3G4C1_ADIVA|nr:unknown [Adineta vaga]
MVNILMLILFSDSDSNKSMDFNNECSIGFSVLSSQMPCIIDVSSCNIEMNLLSPSSIKINETPITVPSSAGNIFMTLSDLTESHLYRVFCSKRRHSSSNSSCSTSIQQTSEQLYDQQIKPSSSHTTGNNKLHFIKGDQITTIGNLKLLWLIYGVDNFIYAGKRYDIFHTCIIDTGLFILYHAYKAHSDEFRNIFTYNSLDIYQIIWRTFQLVDAEGWTTARFYRLTEHNLLENRSSNGDYDLMDTMKAIKPFNLLNLCRNIL